MVGVPDLMLWLEGPTSEIALPMRWPRSQRTTEPPTTSATTNAALPVSSAVVIAAPPRPRR